MDEKREYGKENKRNKEGINIVQQYKSTKISDQLTEK